MLWGTAILFLLIAIFSEGTYDSGDGIQHYLISRYSWKHPELFLHHWGKPFFILISSPFSQFGLFGANIFNILCAAASSFFCYKIAKHLGFGLPVFVVPLLCFAPVYFGVIQSGLTETFFGFILIFCIYLILDGKFFGASVLVSFLPFVRSEGNLILPLFFVLMVYRKKFRAIPFLGLGTLFYSVAGYFYFGDFLWLIHQNPYRGAAEIYGSGEWYHFLLRSVFVWGLPILILLAAGIFYFFRQLKFFQKNNTLPDKPVPVIGTEETLLIFGSFAVYFIAHTVFWWQGIFGSLGLIRVLAGVMPVTALISLRGLNLILPFFRKKMKEQVFILLLFLSVFFMAFAHNMNLFQMNREDVVVKKATDWLKTSGHYESQKIFYMHPYVTLAFGFDRYDRTTNGELWGLDKNNYEKDIPSKSIIIWDAHFGPNEGEINLDGLVSNPHYILLNKFVPDKAFATIGDRDFEVYVFERK